MNVYQTDKNGFLVGQDIADEDPLNPGNFLVPGGCVTIAPPALAANETAQFVNGAWVVKPDFRGKVYWLSNGSKHGITDAGIPIPAGALDAEPPKPLADIKAEKIASLAGARDAATTVPVVVNGKTLSADPAIQTGMKRLGDRVRRGKATSLQAILDTSGNPVSPVNQALLDAYEDAVAANTEASWNHYGQLVAQVNAAVDAASVNAIVW